MDIGKLINIGISVLINPKQAFKKLKMEQMTMQTIITYVAIFAFPGLIGYIIGYGLVDSYKVHIGAAFGFGIFYYIFSIILVIVFGYIINMFAPTFNSKQDLMQSLKLAAYVSTPFLISGIFNILPAIAFLTILFALYGFYLLYLGIPVFMETPKDQHIAYLVICIVVLIVISVILSWVVSQIMWASI
jgi:hypothetical protein